MNSKKKISATLRFCARLICSILPFCAYAEDHPNIILMMADDLGYGDTGFNGNQIIKTPHLDQMAKDGVKLTHFYAGGPVCSPTRGTFLTGRHYFRYGIWSANVGHLPKQEITLARILNSKGYMTGHFGKWHLGTLSKTHSTKGPRRKPAENFAPPWERDYDRSFVVESSVSTWDPGSDKNPFYDDGVPMAGSDESLLGGAARVVVDRAIPWQLSGSTRRTNRPRRGRIIWPCTKAMTKPRTIMVASPNLTNRSDGFESALRIGAWQIIRCSVSVLTMVRKAKRLRERKRELLPACAAANEASTTAVCVFLLWQCGQGKSRLACSTLDYFPMVANLTSFQMPDDRPIDGQDLMPILTGQIKKRDNAIPFRSRSNATLVIDRYKLVLPAGELYNLTQDWSEENDIASDNWERVQNMSRELMSYLESMQKSHAGDDYNDPSFKPLDEWTELKTNQNK